MPDDPQVQLGKGTTATVGGPATVQAQGADVSIGPPKGWVNVYLQTGFAGGAFLMLGWLVFHELPAINDARVTDQIAFLDRIDKLQDKLQTRADTREEKQQSREDKRTEREDAQRVRLYAKFSEIAFDIKQIAIKLGVTLQRWKAETKEPPQ